MSLGLLGTWRTERKLFGPRIILVALFFSLPLYSTVASIFPTASRSKLSSIRNPCAAQHKLQRNFFWRPKHGVKSILASSAVFSSESRDSESDASDIQRFDVDARFTNAASYQNLVFISGQVGEGLTIQDQTRSALAAVDDALRSAGSHKSRILECTIWLADIARDYDGMNEVYDKWLVAGKPPCRACIEAKLASPAYLVEVRVIAAAAVVTAATGRHCGAVP